MKALLPPAYAGTVMFSSCLCVCLPAFSGYNLTFENFSVNKTKLLETSFWYGGRYLGQVRLTRSSSQGQGHKEDKSYFATWTTISFAHTKGSFV